MAFDPSQPAYPAALTSELFRNQFNALKALIDELQTRLGGISGAGAPGANGADEAGGNPPSPGTDKGNGFSASERTGR